MSLAVVTGAPGWLGTPLVAALARGATFRSITTSPRKVRCVVQPGGRHPAARAASETPRSCEPTSATPAALEGAFAGATTVFHAAGIVHPQKVQELYDVNVGGTRALLDAAIQAKAKRFVLVSSNSPAGLNESAGRLMVEDDPPRPYLNYGLSKLQAEWVVNDAHRGGRIESAIARPCWFYGPNQPARQSKFFR